MKNKLIDLNNHIFAELERLGDEDLTAEEINIEIERAKAISGLSVQITELARLQLQAVKLQCEYGSQELGGLKGLISHDE